MFSVKLSVFSIPKKVCGVVFDCVLDLVLYQLGFNVIKTHYSNIEERVQSQDFPLETHEVETSDGYILNVHRIPFSPKCNDADQQRPVVFFQHGVAGSSEHFLLNGPEDAIGFQAASEGFDVWLGNSRGNRYSRQHKELSTRSTDFWKFSFHEMGVYDLPAVIEYIKNKTGQSTIHYVGHSQGTTQLFALMSEHPEYNAVIRTAHLLSPIVYMSHITVPIAKFSYTQKYIPYNGAFEILPYSPLVNRGVSRACGMFQGLEDLCQYVIDYLSGNGTSLNKEVIPQIMDTTPAGISFRQLIHYAQEYLSGKFQQFDFGSDNMKVYKAEEPPEYKLENYKVQTYFHYGDRDFLSNITDVERLLSELDESIVVGKTMHEGYNHIDYLWSKNVKEEVNDIIFKIINQR